MQLDFDKYSDGLVPAIIQDAKNGRVLMLGFMNAEAIEQTRDTGKVTFYSRSKQRLWTKGEESGNFLQLRSMDVDCDSDSILVLADPVGPVCHLGTTTCWGEEPEFSLGFLDRLERVIDSRMKAADTESSYIARLNAKGLEKVAQKVGEEAVEVVIEAMKTDERAFLDESADLMFHYLLLLKAKGYELSDVVEVLRERHK